MFVWQPGSGSLVRPARKAFPEWYSMTQIYIRILPPLVAMVGRNFKICSLLGHIYNYPVLDQASPLVNLGHRWTENGRELKSGTSKLQGDYNVLRQWKDSPGEKRTKSTVTLYCRDYIHWIHVARLVMTPSWIQPRISYYHAVHVSSVV